MTRLLASVCLASLLPFGASAQQATCGPRPLVVESLAKKYGERPIGRGLDGKGYVLEIFVNPTTGTFTAVVNTPQAGGVIACIMTAGKDWQVLEPPTPGDPA